MPPELDYDAIAAVLLEAAERLAAEPEPSERLENPGGGEAA
jgi:hypothetical protein